MADPPALVAHLQREHAFDPTPLRVVLGFLHVPFDELTGSQHVESRLREAVRRGGRIAVIGDSGSGKSSAIWHELGPLTAGVAPLQVPMSTLPTSHLVDPATVVEHVIRTVAYLAAQARLVEDAGRQRVDRALSSHRRAQVTGALRFGLPWLHDNLAVELSRQTEWIQRAGPGERLEILDQLLFAIADAGLDPVLVFDDTDRWIAGHVHGNPDQIVESFFARVVRWAAEDLRCAVVVVVHRMYLRQGRHLLDSLDTRIDLPRLTERSALARLLERRVRWFTNDTPCSGATVFDVFDPAALDALFAWYVQHRARPQLRDVMQVVHMALTEACDAADATITAPLVHAAIAAR